MPFEGERPGALKHGLSKDVVSTSPLQAPGLKAAKTQDKSEANVSMPAGVPSFLARVPQFLFLWAALLNKVVLVLPVVVGLAVLRLCPEVRLEVLSFPLPLWRAGLLV